MSHSVDVSVEIGAVRLNVSADTTTEQLQQILFDRYGCRTQNFSFRGQRMYLRECLPQDIETCGVIHTDIVPLPQTAEDPSASIDVWVQDVGRFDGNCKQYRLKISQKVLKLMAGHCRQRKIELAQVQFYYKSMLLQPEQTLQSLSFKSGDIVQAVHG